MLSVSFLASAQKTPDSMLGAALHQEEVQGDLKGAIATYQKVLAASGVSRKTAAEALVHMGQCYEKLGDAESRRAYERVVREYGDQKDAVTIARARLGPHAATQSSGIITRQVWRGPKVYSFGSTISPDGRFISFPDWETGELAIHDLSSGTDRRLTNKGGWSESEEFAEESVIAPDGKQVVYAWWDGKTRYELRVIGISAGGTPRTLYRNEDIEYIAPFDWSSDKKWIAVNIMRADRTVQIGIVDAESGALRVLKSGEWSGAGKLAFSPDGQLLAFDRPASDTGQQRDIFILAVDGSREIPAVRHPSMDTVVAWSTDGTKLLFASDRTGATGVWATPVRDGKPEGPAELVKSDVGPLYPLGLTRSGVLHYGLKVGGPDIHVVSIDFSSGKLLAPPSGATTQFMGSNRTPDWSPDGKYLVYVTQDRASATRFSILTIQEMETGTIRQLRPKLGYIQLARWSPKGSEFLVVGVDLKARPGIYRVDAQTGEAAAVRTLASSENLRNVHWAPDGKRIYYGLQKLAGDTAGETAIIERHLDSGQERELFRKKDIAPRSIGLSPDGRYMTVIAADRTDAVLSVMPLDGSAPRELLRESRELWAGEFTTWTPDSEQVLLVRGKEIWIMPLSGSPLKKVTLGLNDMRGIRAQPRGNQVVFFTGANPEEIWTLENFLSGVPVKK
jgi:Tol biopolymer transport system component